MDASLVRIFGLSLMALGLGGMLSYAQLAELKASGQVVEPIKLTLTLPDKALVGEEYQVHTTIEVRGSYLLNGHLIVSYSRYPDLREYVVEYQGLVKTTQPESPTIEHQALKAIPNKYYYRAWFDGCIIDKSTGETTCGKWYSGTEMIEIVGVPKIELELWASDYDVRVGEVFTIFLRAKSMVSFPMKGAVDLMLGNIKLASWALVLEPHESQTFSLRYWFDKPGVYCFRAVASIVFEDMLEWQVFKAESNQICIRAYAVGEKVGVSISAPQSLRLGIPAEIRAIFFNQERETVSGNAYIYRDDELVWSSFIKLDPGESIKASYTQISPSEPICYEFKGVLWVEPYVRISKARVCWYQIGKDVSAQISGFPSVIPVGSPATIECTIRNPYREEVQGFGYIFIDGKILQSYGLVVDPESSATLRADYSSPVEANHSFICSTFFYGFWNHSDRITLSWIKPVGKLEMITWLDYGRVEPGQSYTVWALVNNARNLPVQGELRVMANQEVERSWNISLGPWESLSVNYTSSKPSQGIYIYTSQLLTPLASFSSNPFPLEVRLVPTGVVLLTLSPDGIQFKPGQEYRILVSITNARNIPLEGRLRLYANAEVELEERVSLDPQEQVSIEHRSSKPEPGTYIYTAVLSTPRADFVSNSVPITVLKVPEMAHVRLDLSVPRAAFVNQSYNVSVVVTSSFPEAVTGDLEVMVNGLVEHSQTITLEPFSPRRIEYTASKPEDGIYTYLARFKFQRGWFASNIDSIRVSKHPFVWISQLLGTLLGIPVFWALIALIGLGIAAVVTVRAGR